MSTEEKMDRFILEQWVDSYDMVFDMVAKAMLAKFGLELDKISVQDGRVRAWYNDYNGPDYELFDLDNIMRLQ